MANVPSILIVDDEEEITELIEMYLVRENYEVHCAHSGESAVAAAEKTNPDLVILDILLPDMDGLEICRIIREKTSAPILFISCKWEDADKITALDVGGDDYLTKPFSPSELVARVKAHLRRNRMLKQLEDRESGGRLHFKDMMIDLYHHTLVITGQTIPLSVKEFELLAVLAEAPGQVFSIEQLFHKVWGSDSLGDTRTVLVHMSNLRKKIEKDPARPEFIITVRGNGYYFAATPAK